MTTKRGARRGNRFRAETCYCPFKTSSSGLGLGLGQSLKPLAVLLAYVMPKLSQAKQVGAREPMLMRGVFGQLAIGGLRLPPALGPSAHRGGPLIKTWVSVQPGFSEAENGITLEQAALMAGPALPLSTPTRWPDQSSDLRDGSLLQTLPRLLSFHP